jgi:hypothetical protein
MLVSVNNLFDGESAMNGYFRDERHTHPLLVIKVEATIRMGCWHPRGTVLLEKILLRTTRFGKTEESSIN